MTTAPIQAGIDKSEDTFSFPAPHAFPPFYTLQPNTSTRRAQLASWSSVILSWARSKRIFKLHLSDAVESELFNNKIIRRRLSLRDAREVVDYMTREGRAEWISPAGPKGGGTETCLLYWRRPDEWAEMIDAWIDSTGQRGSVLTFYELLEGDGTKGTEFHALDSELLKKSLRILVQRSKAQVFGAEGMEGVKFF